MESRIKKFSLYPDYDFLVFSTLIFTNTIQDAEFILNVPTTEDTLVRFLKMDVPWLTTAPIWKKDTLVELGTWDEKALSWQDWELHIRALLKKF